MKTRMANVEKMWAKVRVGVPTFADSVLPDRHGVPPAAQPNLTETAEGEHAAPGSTQAETG